MPPALSDQEDSSGEDEVPPQPKATKGKGKEKSVDDHVDEGPGQNEDKDSGSEEAEDEYIVEKIMGHKFVKGQLVFHVKWQGYDDPNDQTWEPEDNMTGAVDVMKEYFEEIGGRPEPKGGQKRKGRASVAKSDSGTPATVAKRPKQEKQWSPPPGSWEHDVSHVDTVEEQRDPKTGDLTRYAYLVWNNQKKTQHPLKHVYQKCPQKMLAYYESHLVFTHPENDISGDEGSNLTMDDAY
ncbi:hypothetical protein IAQ61_001304 [Plenodomus lingam]|uniref:Similar to chromo domain-containing protein n=1 Tax=Leptosphaeria maculans (strain JN3 / isolate v23.1.3 / race Av1-4-5-6-7-8) TaxID=985895 RepID=E4ZXM7_LEPMJ|nr:similar to chromo domain-containing protein [Plenodomus lingam JN3]KAH9879486.1 hypothetical protein IAQ61_001304 [Plenodomus lingam]CBX96122.1 similar to chromo domain-containing protein [Plenodomus lingam JN3]